MDSEDQTGAASSIKTQIGENDVGDTGGSLDEGEMGKQCEEVSQSDRRDQEDSELDNSISCRERDRLKMSKL